MVTVGPDKFREAIGGGLTATVGNQSERERPSVGRLGVSSQRAVGTDVFRSPRVTDVAGQGAEGGGVLGSADHVGDTCHQVGSPVEVGGGDDSLVSEGVVAGLDRFEPLTPVVAGVPQELLVIGRGGTTSHGVLVPAGRRLSGRVLEPLQHGRIRLRQDADITVGSVELPRDDDDRLGPAGGTLHVVPGRRKQFDPAGGSVRFRREVQDDTVRPLIRHEIP